MLRSSTPSWSHGTVHHCRVGPRIALCAHHALRRHPEPRLQQVAATAPMLLPALAICGLCVLAYQLTRLVLADCDLRLLSRGLAPPGAFTGKVVWVVGASQGLGKQLALYWAARGAKLILSARSEERLQAVAEEARRLVPAEEVQVLTLDLTGPFPALQAAAQAADSYWGGAGVDFMVLCAGASMAALAVDTEPEVVQALFSVNTLGPIHLTRAALPLMLARSKGRIVVVASMAGKVPSPGQSVYSACKMAVFGYFSSLATEVAGSGVAVTLVCPGPVAASPGPPRAVYGPQGLQQQTGAAAATSSADKARMPAARCVELIAAAAAHGVDEAWISRHPVLALAYVYQLLPTVGWFLLKKIGPKRARALKEGKSGYSVRGMAFGESRESKKLH
ncbi:hypothetical protein V8C86DRAFT_2536220 [Haematococcus lacustris]